MSNSPVFESLKDKVAIVTGSGRGLGAATALRLARDGAHVIVNDIQKESANEVSSEISRMGRKTLASTHDVSDYKSAGTLVAEVLAQFGKIDILVNNAGITRDSMLHKLSEEKWDEVIRVNLKGPFNMGQACARSMMERKTGKIVNIASVAYLGNIGQTNYSASKAGLVGMTHTWAAELARHQINVNAIAPGFIDSALTQQVPAELIEKYLQRIPLRRIGKPEEVANLVAFLTSDHANYITGQIIHIDGGLTASIS